MIDRILEEIGEVGLKLSNDLKGETNCLYNQGNNNYKFGKSQVETPMYYYDGKDWEQIIFKY